LKDYGEMQILLRMCDGCPAFLIDKSIAYYIHVFTGKWRRTQVARERSAKPLCSGSNPLGAS
jgi:hypothetical protein